VFAVRLMHSIFKRKVYRCALSPEVFFVLLIGLPLQGFEVTDHIFEISYNANKIARCFSPLGVKR